MINSDNNKNLGGKKWNDEGNPNVKNEKNEGFSGGNIPSDYNPAPLKTEKDIDAKGDAHFVDRARNEDANPNHKAPNIGDPQTADNTKIEEPNRVENRDRNYDDATNRYPASHPENKENRGNINLDD